MSTVGKSAFDDATFKYDGSNFGIIDVELGQESSEIDVSDTESPPAESEFLAGKNSRSISFTAFHKVGTDTLPTRQTKSYELIAQDEDGNTTSLSGNCILLTKNITGAREGAIQVAYSGRITGAQAEAHDSAS